MLLMFILFISCNNDSGLKKTEKLDEVSEANSDTIPVTVYSGQKVICANCKKVLKDNTDTLKVPKNEMLNFKVAEIEGLCKTCKEQIPTKREIQVYNDFMSEDMNRIDYGYPSESDVDKKIMRRYKLSKKGFTEIVMKVNMWAMENGYLTESQVTDAGKQRAVYLLDKFKK